MGIIGGTMKEKQWLVSESELEELKWIAENHQAPRYALKKWLRKFCKNPVSKLDRDRVEQAIKESAVSITLGNDEKLFAVDIEVAIKNICSLAVQPVDRDRVEEIVMPFIDTEFDCINYRDIQLMIDAICKKGDKE
jgi:hypothetical protein